MYHIFYDPRDNDYCAFLEKLPEEFTILRNPPSGQAWHTDLLEIASSFIPANSSPDFLGMHNLTRAVGSRCSLVASVMSLKDLESTYPELFI